MGLKRVNPWDIPDIFSCPRQEMPYKDWAKDIAAELAADGYDTAEILDMPCTVNEADAVLRNTAAGKGLTVIKRGDRLFISQLSKVELHHRVIEYKKGIRE